MDEIRIYKLPDSILDKPVALDADKHSLTLREVVGRMDDIGFMWLSDLKGNELSSLVIERLKLESSEEVWVLGGVYSTAEVIEAVQKRSDLGKFFIRAEKLHIADLKDKMASGRYVIAEE